MNLNQNIFRGYDIRGIYKTELDEDTAYLIGKAFGSILIEEQKTITIIGHDNRKSSPSLFDALAKGINEMGIDIINIGLVTTPMFYYALTLYKATSGIMITASHNPKDDNGLKITLNGIYNAFGDDIQMIKNRILNSNFITPNKTGTIHNESINQRYVDYINSSINITNNKPKVVIDCGNGTASVIIKEVMQKANMPYIPIFCESNPDFPNHHPDPSVESNLEYLKSAVKQTNAAVGIAFDGDGDRIGIVDENGNMINIDQFMIIILRDIINTIPNKTILFDVKCSKTLADEIVKLGGTLLCYRTGNSYLREKMVQEKLSFGGELAGHVFFADKFHGFDDGIYAALRLIEILSKTNKKPSELLEGINKYYSTRENKLAVSDSAKFHIIDKVTTYAQNKDYEVLTIDGCKVIFEDGFALVRASNTGPNITTRYEAKTEERLKEIQTEFEDLLDQLKRIILN